MGNQVLTVTTVGNARISVTGTFQTDSKRTLKDIQKILIYKHINADYGVDLSAIQSEHVTQAKEEVKP